METRWKTTEGEAAVPLSPLLQLTPRIRGRIYRYVGLAAWEGQWTYKFDLHGQLVSPVAPKPRDFYGLLLSCRAIYAEAAELLYSANRFIIHYQHGHPEPLKPLHALSPTSLASLTCLIIVINQSSCHHPYAYVDYSACCVDGYGAEEGLWTGTEDCSRSHNGLHHPPLLLSPTNGNDVDRFMAAQSVLSTWQAAATRLSYITERRLELAFVCDIDPQDERAVDVAMGATAPLRRLPPLKKCHIRLCKTRDVRLQQVAQDCALQACRATPPPYFEPSSTRSILTSLPRELRLHILEYTDLIVPSREVVVGRQDPGYMTFCINSGMDSDFVGGYAHRRQFFRCCWPHYPRRPFVGCFCRRRHAVYSFPRSNCNCWAPPGPDLFLICRTLTQDAELVFFSGNRFIVYDHHAPHGWRVPFWDGRARPEARNEAVPSYPYPYERLNVSHFLRDVIPTRCIAYLRFLELVFPPYFPRSWPRAGHPAMQDWYATIEWLRDKINAPGFTLRLVVADFSDEDYTPTMSRSDGDDIMDAYRDLVGPLKPLGESGLSRFSADLAYPWIRTQQYPGGPPGPYRARKTWRKLERMKLRLKESAERYVMGDRYESMYANNKAGPEPSCPQTLQYSCR